MTFSIAAGVLLVLAVVLVVWPLLRPRGARDAREHALDVYKDQLDEIDRDRDRGLIEGEQAAAARLEVQRRLVAVARTAPSAPGGVRPRPVVAIVVAALLVGGSVFVYGELGSPRLPGQPLSQRDQSTQIAERREMAAELAQLEPLVDTDAAEDPMFWLALGQLRAELLGPAEAEAAYRDGLGRNPDDPELLAALGESLVGQAGGSVIPVARAAFERALRLRPDQRRALYYLGLAASQEGDDVTAVGHWARLLATSPPDAPWHDSVETMLVAAAGRADLDPVAAVAEARSAAPPMPASTALGPVPEAEGAEQDAMIREMVAGLEARLQEAPDDLQGWIRLGRSQIVLGDEPAGAAAFARARALAPADADVLRAEADAHLAVAERIMGVPKVSDRVVEIYGEVASLDPGDPQPHWFVGLWALQTGDVVAARTAWERVLAMVDPESPDHAAIKQQLEALDSFAGG
ncbi:MAG: c-type cytochrome biogenesis protein CcmI [Pseudomonadota bacterium]